MPNYYDGYSSMGGGFLWTVLAGSIIIILLLLVVALVFYVLNSIALMTMANNRGIDNAWLAWIPFGCFYIAGKLSGPTKIGEYKIPTEWALNGVLLAKLLFHNVALLGPVSSLLFIVYGLYVVHMIYKQYAEQSAVLYTVFSVIGLAPIFLFMIRNNEAVIVEE